MTSARRSEIFSDTLPAGRKQVSRAGCVSSLNSWLGMHRVHEVPNVEFAEHTWLVELDGEDFLPIQVQCRVTPSGHNAHIAGGD